MFIEVNFNTYVNLEQVKSIELVEGYKESYWIFRIDSGTDYSDGVISSYKFTRKDAILWFEENIKPALENYNKIKFGIQEV